MERKLNLHSEYSRAGRQPSGLAPSPLRSRRVFASNPRQTITLVDRRKPWRTKRARKRKSGFSFEMPLFCSCLAQPQVAQAILFGGLGEIDPPTRGFQGFSGP